MTCEQIREAASARLDGETIGLPPAVLDEHLRTCVGCARWLTEATSLTRTMRLSSVAVPDLSERIMAVIDVPRPRATAARLLRVVLAVVGLTQLAVALPAVFGDSMGMAMSMHSAHESAAWNAALGAAFLVVAVRPRQAAALVPVTGAFVVLLAALSAHDLVTGDVGADRLLTHLGCLVALVVLLALARLMRLDQGTPSPVRVGNAPDETSTPRLRGVA